MISVMTLRVRTVSPETARVGPSLLKWKTGEKKSPIYSLLKTQVLMMQNAQASFSHTFYVYTDSSGKSKLFFKNSKKSELLFHLVQTVQKVHSVRKHEACGIFCLSYSCVSCIPTKQRLPHPPTSQTLLIQAINLQCHRSRYPELARVICPLQVRWLRLTDWSFGFLRSDHLTRSAAIKNRES